MILSKRILSAIALASLLGCNSSSDVYDVDARRPNTEQAAVLPQQINAPKRSGASVMGDAMEAGSAVGEAAMSPEAVTETGQEAMLIRQGQAVIEVDSLEPAMSRVEEMTARNDGLVANVTIRSGTARFREATMELRIPAENFDATVAGLEPLGEVETLDLRTQDVTEEFVDVDARVRNAQKLEDRILRLIDTRTGELNEVLQAERELARVRGEIERYQARMRYLSNRVDVSRITVVLREPIPLTPRPEPRESLLLRALKDAWRGTLYSTAHLIVMVGTALPLLVVLLAGVSALYYLFRRRRSAKNTRDD